MKAAIAILVLTVATGAAVPTCRIWAKKAVTPHHLPKDRVSAILAWNKAHPDYWRMRTEREKRIVLETYQACAPVLTEDAELDLTLTPESQKVVMPLLLESDMEPNAPVTPPSEPQLVAVDWPIAQPVQPILPTYISPLAPRRPKCHAPAVTPEPTSLVLFLTGLCALIAARKVAQ